MTPPSRPQRTPGKVAVLTPHRTVPDAMTLVVTDPGQGFRHPGNMALNGHWYVLTGASEPVVFGREYRHEVDSCRRLGVE